VNYSFPDTFEKLKQWEDHSVTSYLLLVKKSLYPVVKWWETMESRMGLFDQLLVLQMTMRAKGVEVKRQLIRR
jgi:hypothetical protein